MFHSVLMGLKPFCLCQAKHQNLATHIHDAVDSKRMMSMVVIALVPALLFGMFNVGYQRFSHRAARFTYWNPQTAQFWKHLFCME